MLMAFTCLIVILVQVQSDKHAQFDSVHGCRSGLGCEGSHKYTFLEVHLTLKPERDSKVWASNFSLQHHFPINHNGNENKENDKRAKTIFTVKQILPICTTAIVWRTFWKMCKLLAGSKGLRWTCTCTITFCWGTDKHAIWEKQYEHLILQFLSTAIIFWAWFSQLSKYIPLTTDTELETNTGKQKAVGCRTLLSSIVVAKFLKKKAVEIEVNSKVKND